MWELLALWQGRVFLGIALMKMLLRLQMQSLMSQSGTSAFQTAKKLKKNSRKWMRIAIIILLLLACLEM
jgi:uncharacterized membrane protein YecN with MAPEG domain